MAWRVAAVAASLMALAAFGWAALLVFQARGNAPVAVAGEPAAVASPTAHITATVFFGAPNGRGLVARRVEVPLQPTVVAQGEAILEAVLGDPPAGLARVIPDGARLRAFFVDASGDAYLDLSPEVQSAHPGGSFNEALTISALVNAVTTNLRAVRRVQLLVGGEEVETLAGHVDVSQPLVADAALVVAEAARGVSR